MPKRLLLALVALPLWAQQQAPGPIPVNAQTVDLFSWVTARLDALMANGGNIFVPMAQSWLTYLGTAVLVGICIDLAFADGGHLNASVLRKFFIGYAISYFMLVYYVVPIPGVGVSFMNLFRVESRYLASTIDIQGMDLVLSKFANIFAHMEHPSVWDVQAVGVYFIVLAEMAVFSIALFVVNAQALIYLAMALILLPLTIPWRGVPHADHYFWSALSAVVKYSLMRVAASALVYVFGGVISTYIDTNLPGANPDWSLAHFTFMLPGMSVVMISGALCIFGVKHFVSDFTTGGAGAVGSGSGIVMSVARMFV